MHFSAFTGHQLSIRFCLAALSLALCESTARSQPPAPHALVAPGNHRCYYWSAVDGTAQPYYVYVPRDYDPTTPHPVVFSLHGFGGRTGAPAADAWRQNWADSHGWLLVRLDGRGSQNWDGIGEDDIFAVIADLQQETPFHPAFPVDTERLYLEGCSMGGHGAFREGFRYPGRFAAVAPAAGWTMYQEFYPHWYDRAAAPHMPGYVDPARRPVLETASSFMQTPNARWQWIYITYDTGDRVNPPKNAQEVIKRLPAAGNARYAVRKGSGGHCRSYSAAFNYRFFLGKQATTAPPEVSYTTNDLRYSAAYWVAIDRFILMGAWASVSAQIKPATASSPAQVRVRTRNVRALTLSLDKSPLAASQPVQVLIDDSPPLSLRRPATTTFSLGFDLRGQRLHWSVGAAADRPPVHKRRGLSGPLADAFRSRFIVVFGTRGGRLGAHASNPDWAAAQRFATEWNNWMSLHWRAGRPPAERRHDWWQPPYPWPPGPHIPDWQPLVTPEPDTDYTLKNLPADANWILFGDPSTNHLVRALAPSLPLALLEDGAGIVVGPRLYTGDHVGYTFICETPLHPSRYVVISRGYLSSNIDPARYGAGKVGKDLEALPFYWPDYVVWDMRARPSKTVQDPLRYLPEVWLDAGYFDERWRLDDQPPVTAIKLEAKRDDSGRAIDGVRVRLSASDSPGGFGVSGIEYRLDDGPWRDYRRDFRITAVGRSRLQVRATDRCGQFVYRRRGPTVVGEPAPGNVEHAKTAVFEVAAPSATMTGNP